MKTIDNRIARTIVLVVSLMMSFPVFGQNADAVDLNLARRVGENFFKMNDNIKLSVDPGSLRRVETDEFPNLYIFNVEGGGSIIVAGDKRVRPILGFSEKGTFDPNNLPPAAEMIIGGYDYVVDSIVRHDVRFVEESVKQAWIDLENGCYRKVQSVKNLMPEYPLSCGPLLTTAFKQGDYGYNQWQNNYNEYCPIFEVTDNNNNVLRSLRALTGCGATTMTQLLYFHKDRKPSGIDNKIVEGKSVSAFQGRFSQDNSSLNLNPADVPVPLKIKGIDVAAHTYKDYMIEGDYWFEYYDWDYSNESPNEVAKTMYFCGLKIASKYRVIIRPENGNLYFIADTESNLASILDVLKNTFNYPKAFIKSRDEYNSNWDDTLKKYISHRIPLLYRGAKNENNSGGHFYIIDGYITDEVGVFFHHNFGLYDLNDKYYFSSLSPNPNFSHSPFAYHQWFLSTIPIKDKCKPEINCLNANPQGLKDPQTTDQLVYESITKYHEYMDAMSNYLLNVIGGTYWLDEEKGIAFWNLFQSLLDDNTGMISEAGIQQLINQNQFEEISEDLIMTIAERYNQSVLYWNEGYYTNESLPEGYGNMIEYDTAAMRKAYEAQAYAESLGFSNVGQMYDNAYEMLEAEVNHTQSSVCAKVTVKFSQKASMTREAFNGTLQIFNGHESIPMQNILVDFRIEDQQGNDCTHLFQINTLSLDSITCG